MNIEELINSLSDEIKSLVLENDWTNALNKANDDEKNTVAEIYLRTLCEHGNQWESIGWSKLEPIKSVLIKWIKELGFKESTNPYMQFIPAFYSIQESQSKTLSENNCIELNNLYADGVLDFADIAGTGENKLDHVIFNKNLYNKTMSDLEFIVKAYEALSTKSTVSKLNLDAVKNELIRYKKQNVANYVEENKSDIKAIRNAIIFKDPTQPQTSEIYDRNVIEDLLSSGENTVSEKENRELKKQIDDFKAKTDETERKKLGLTDDALANLFAKGAKIY